MLNLTQVGCHPGSMASPREPVLQCLRSGAIQAAAEQLLMDIAKPESEKVEKRNTSKLCRAVAGARLL